MRAFENTNLNEQNAKIFSGRCWHSFVLFTQQKLSNVAISGAVLGTKVKELDINKSWICVQWKLEAQMENSL